MGNSTLKLTRRKLCHAKGVSIDKIPTLRSHDTANPPPSKEITGITRSNQPQQSTSSRSTPTQMALSTAGPSPSLQLPSPALAPDYFASFPSSLSRSTPNISRRPSPLTEKVGTGKTSYTLSREYQSHTYPSLLRPHQTPKVDYPPSWQETCHVTIACGNEIKLSIAVVEGGRENTAFWVL